MNIDTNTIFSMTEANQNFSMVARTVDQYGTAIIFKNNKPRYEIRVFDDAETDEKIQEISPGVKGQKVKIKLPIKCEKDWIIRRKK